MKTIKINYLSVQNFICFREKQEINFDELSNVISVIGENKDAKTSDTKIKSSNGSGKSTLAEAIFFGAFGETIKRFEKNSQVIHNLAPDGTATVELIFNDEYRVLRTQKKSGGGVKLWKSKDRIWDKATEITRSTKAETDKYIIDLLGLSPAAFISIAIFSDDQRGCFLECDPKSKRDVVENLLSLSVYRERQEKANQLVNSTKNDLKELKKVYQEIQNNLDNCKNVYNDAVKKDANWKIALKNDRDALIARAKQKKYQLEKVDNATELLAYQKAQEQIPLIKSQISEIEDLISQKNNSVETFRGMISTQKNDQNQIAQQLNSLKQQIKYKQDEARKHEIKIQNLNNNVDGERCEHCNEIINMSNIDMAVASHQISISECKTQITSDLKKAEDLQKSGKELLEKIGILNTDVSRIEKEINEKQIELKKLQSELMRILSIKEPQVDGQILLLKNEIDRLKSEAKEKNDQLQAGSTPFADLIVSTKTKVDEVQASLDSHENRIKDAESKIPYYEYWKIGFGDNGIRQTILEDIIPVLNECISGWLQPLVANSITLKFNTNLEETIERNPPDGDPYVYSGMSAGQRRRLNLAISQAFADIMAISNGAKPSLVFLDEVTTNIDPIGVQGIFNMIQELSKEKQVFVTTHDHDLLNMLEIADTIKLVHEHGKTEIQVSKQQK